MARRAVATDQDLDLWQGGRAATDQDFDLWQGGGLPRTGILTCGNMGGLPGVRDEGLLGSAEAARTNCDERPR